MKTEFFLNGHGRTLIVNDLVNDTFSQFSQDDKDLIESVLKKIEEDYPEANERLSNLYDKKACHKFLKVRRFLKCNFSENDHEPDIDDESNFCLEMVHCPLRGECIDENIICNPKLNTILTERELEYVPLLISGLSDEEIGERLFVSPDTVKNTRKKIFRKLGIRGPKALTLLTNYAYKNKIV